MGARTDRDPTPAAGFLRATAAVVADAPDARSEAGAGRAEIRVLICAAVRLYREGIALVLERRPGVRCVGTTASPEEALSVALSERVDVVLVDLDTPESLDAVRHLRRLRPATKTVVLGLAESDGMFLACMEAGVSGYVSSDATLEDLVHTIRSVQRGELPCSPQVAGRLLHRLTALATERTRPGAPAHSRLTPREDEIVQLIEAGLSNKEIAARLSISLPTVKNHVHNILEKLNLVRRAQVASYMRRERAGRT